MQDAFYYKYTSNMTKPKPRKSVRLDNSSKTTHNEYLYTALLVRLRSINQPCI